MLNSIIHYYTIFNYFLLLSTTLYPLPHLPKSKCNIQYCNIAGGEKWGKRPNHANSMTWPCQV